MTQLIITIFLALIFVVYFYYWIVAFLISAPYYPSSGKVKKLSVEIFKKNRVKHIVELGAGDGKIAVALAKEGFEVTAVEINPILALVILFRKLIGRHKKLHVHRGDFLKMDFQRFDGAYIYLYPKVMDKLSNKLFKEMPKNSVILSNTFVFHKKKSIRDFPDIKLHQYRVD